MPSIHSIELLALCIIALIIGGTVLWIWMLVDCVMNKRISDSQKTVWILVMIFTHLLGALLYLFLGRSTQKAQNTYQSYVQPQARPVSQEYNSYQQGYQAAQPTSSPSQPTPVVPYEQNPPLDYEQPQAMYPHEQNNNE